MIVVGTKDCPIHTLVQKVMKDENYAVSVKANYASLFRTLGVPFLTRLKMGDDLRSGMKEIGDILEQGLVDWTVKDGENATLPCLISALKSLDMESIAQFLENEFIECSIIDVDVKNPLLNWAEDKTENNLIKKHKRCIYIGLSSLLVAIIIVVVLIVYRENIKYHLSGVSERNSSSTLQKNISLLNTKDEEIRKFNKSVHRSLNITISNPINMQTKPILTYGEYVIELNIDNLTDFNSILPILKQAPNLETLKIKSPMKDTCRSNIPLLKIGQPELSVSIFSTSFPCITNYSFFFLNYQVDRLSKGVMLGFNIDNQNVNFTRQILFMSRTFMSTLEIKGKADTEIQLFSFDEPLVNVTKLHIDLQYENINLENKILGNQFCSMLPNINVFTSNMSIEYIDFLNILSCPKIKNISAHVTIISSGEFLNISSEYTGNELESVQLTFEFKPNCPHCSKIYYLGLSSFKKRIPLHSITFLNCGCEENFELEYVKKEVGGNMR